MATSDPQSYNILLVGKTGSGKSSTGNSILEKNVFQLRKPHDSSDGDVIACHSSVVDGRYVSVVDGTGIGDTYVDFNEGVKSLLQSVETTIIRQDMSCFNAIIVVHSIYERSEIKLKKSVFEIKSIFGHYVLKHWGIIVVTFGDLFDLNNLDENIHSFKDWCQQQTGYFQILLEECNNRCVLFDNKTADKNKQKEQRNKLMSVVDSIIHKQYTIDDFDSPTFKLSRQQLILMEEVNRKLEELDVTMNSRHDVSKQELELLMSQLLEHIQFLTRQGQEPEFTKQLLNEVKETVNKLQLKIGKVFQAFKPTVWEQWKYLRPIQFKVEEPTTSKTQKPLSPTVAELPARKVTTSCPEIQDDKKSIATDASGRQELDIENETLKEMCTLLLVGRSRNGRSSVINSILGQKMLFKTRVPSEVTRLTNEIHNNDEYVVVDGLGIGDKGAEMPGDMSSVVLAACEVLLIKNNSQEGLITRKFDNRPTLLHRCGFDALIFVLKYSFRFTKQEKDAVQMVKSIFGENVFRDWGILVFSYGDCYEYDYQESNKTFKDVCMKKRGDIKALFEEVSYRCVLFNNKTKDRDKLEQQRRELSNNIQELKKKTNKEVGQNKYCIEDLIAVRKKHFQDTFDRLSVETEKLFAETNTNDTKQIWITLKGKWLNLRTKVKEELEIFSWEAKSQTSPETNHKSKTTPDQQTKRKLFKMPKPFGELRKILTTNRNQTTKDTTVNSGKTQNEFDSCGETQGETDNSVKTQVKGNNNGRTQGEAGNSGRTEVDSDCSSGTQTKADHFGRTQEETHNIGGTHGENDKSGRTQCEAGNSGGTNWEYSKSVTAHMKADNSGTTQFETGNYCTTQWEAGNSGTTQLEYSNSCMTQGKAGNSGTTQGYAGNRGTMQLEADLPTDVKVKMYKYQLMISRGHPQFYFHPENMLMEYTQFLKKHLRDIDKNIKIIKTDQNGCLLS